MQPPVFSGGAAATQIDSSVGREDCYAALPEVKGLSEISTRVPISDSLFE